MNAAMAVVIAPGSAPELELRGPLDEDALREALAGLPSGTTTLRRHTATHHTLRLPRQHSPAGTVADLLTTPGARPRRTPARPQAPRTAWAGAGEGPAGREASGGVGGLGGPAAQPATGLPASARQREVLLDSLTGRPGAGLYVEQLHWRWYGPLDTGRFHAAWQRVFAQEPVLRAAFADRARADGCGAGPRVLVHAHASPEIVRHHHGSADWHSLLASERLRPFDLHRPGLMRIALLDEGPGSAGPTRIALTHHHAMLDGWSVRLLLRAFYRAYRAEGRSTGGERRPDVRDHLRWLAGQDLAPPRAFWSQAAPVPGCRTLPCPPAHATAAEGGSRRGRGLARERLTPSEAARLRDWAAGHGAAESTALHAAWAMLLYRSGGAGAVPAPVAFAMAVSGRGIALEGAAGIPAPLRNALPVHVEVDPAAPLRLLLADLRDRALGAAAYEWVSAGQIREWSGRTEPGGLTESLLFFEDAQGRPPGRDGRDGRDPLGSELAAEGCRVDPPQTTVPSTPQPVVVSARHDADGALLLTAVNDRTRVADGEAAAALARTARLLRAFPVLADGTTRVGEILRTLGDPGDPGDLPTAGPAAPAPVPPGGGPRTLRAAERPGAGTILLVPPPAAPKDCYDALVHAHRGPEALTTITAPADAPACLAALRPALAAGEPLLLGCFSGGGSVAYEVAQRVAAHGWLPPLVAIAGTADGSPESVRRLARTLAAAGWPG
ncbi:condensation domain-containing protein [Streptomyces sp. NPDC059918]|uniref:condensation domain-containing protein n=1 Tax=unclassified Streptomyces TaxID=2593676 RepID=UPI00366438BD